MDCLTQITQTENKKNILLTQNQVYKKYRLTPTRQKKLIANGILIKTIDGLINESSVIKYLDNK